MGKIMKVKIVGFRVGQSKPTANITIEEIGIGKYDKKCMEFGDRVISVLAKSDFVSIRRL